jgi:hypothetical protein
VCIAHAQLLVCFNANPFSQMVWLLRNTVRLLVCFNANPFSQMVWLLRNTVRCLQSWSAETICNIQVQLSLASEVVHWLEMACDRQTVASHEEALRQLLNIKSLGLVSLQCTIMR